MPVSGHFGHKRVMLCFFGPIFVIFCYDVDLQHDFPICRGIKIWRKKKS